MLRPKRRKWKVQARKKDKIEKKKSEMQNWPISAKRPVSEVREANGAIPEAKMKENMWPNEVFSSHLTKSQTETNYGNRGETRWRNKRVGNGNY